VQSSAGFFAGLAPFALTVFGLVVASAGAAHAQEGVLHEYVPDLDPHEVAAALAPNARREPNEAGAETEVGTEKKTGASRSEAADEEASGGSRDDDAPAGGGNAAESFRPDRLTSLEGGLDYYEAFTPSIAPFKRVMAFDAVRLDVDGKTPVLGVHDPQRRHLSIERAAASDPRPRDAFVGRLSLDFRSERVQRLPSVSPESRILGIQSSAEIPLQIERDAADNYFVRARGPLPERSVEVTFQTDAPRAYFGSAIPAVPLRSLQTDLPPLQPTIKRRGLRFAAELGLSPRSDLRSALEILTRHFRAFVESASPPENTGDLFLDLARGGKGLCRHRAYAFVVTAQSLGIAARFVQNEAHSWVEVQLADAGWLRIDLGGAAHGLTAHNAHDRQNYLPAQPDTLPRPTAYRQSYARAEVPRSAQPALGAESLAGRWLTEPEPRSEPALQNSAKHTTEGDATVTPDKVPLHVALSDRRMNALRGGKQVLTGRIADRNEHGIPELRVEVWIARSKPRERMLLGVTTTDAEGYFRAAFGVPPDLAVGDYRMVVVSPGDEHYQAVISD
jgi:hypothetical protein